MTITYVPTAVREKRGVETEHYYGSPGSYGATFVLGIPGAEMFRSDFDRAGFLASGDSLLHMGTGEPVGLEQVIRDTSLHIILKPNARNMLATIEFSFPAPALQAAHNLARDIIMPILSWLSFHHNVALDIAGYLIVEETTDAEILTLGVLGHPRHLDAGAAGFLTVEFVPPYSAYREGLNSTNPFYQVLSFYKVIEWVHGWRKERKKRRIARKHPIVGKFPGKLEELTGVSESELPYFEPHLGKSYDSVIERSRMVLRQAAAHLNPGKKVIIADRSEDVAQCIIAIPLLRYMAREMLINELQEEAEEGDVVPPR